MGCLGWFRNFVFRGYRFENIPGCHSHVFYIGFSFYGSGTHLIILKFYLQLIVWAPTRERAIARMKRALNDTVITGKDGRI